VPHTVPRVGRSYEHFPDGFELHLLRFPRKGQVSGYGGLESIGQVSGYPLSAQPVKFDRQEVLGRS
jgi:hypothetical protein